MSLQVSVRVVPATTEATAMVAIHNSVTVPPAFKDQSVNTV